MFGKIDVWQTRDMTTRVTAFLLVLTVLLVSAGSAAAARSGGIGGPLVPSSRS
jgi:hypothetical protein